MSGEDVGLVLNRLENARCFADIFGSLSGGGLALDLKKIKIQFAYLAKIVHADRVSAECAKEANRAFDLLMKKFQAAKQAAKNGEYEKRFAPAAEKIWNLSSAADTYQLAEAPYQTGNFSIIYRGSRESDSALVLVKVAAEPKQNQVLEDEARFLDKFHTPKTASLLYRISAYIPRIIDYFFVEDGRGKRFRAHVMLHHPRFFSIEEVRGVYPEGLDPRDGAWIFRRIAAQIISAEMAGVAHGALTPDHILVDPVSHDPLHIGWAHAVPKNSQLNYVSEKWLDWYPPEAFSKEAVDFRTDLYMAAKTMIFLSGGDARRNIFPASYPESVTSVILSALRKRRSERPGGSRQFLDELTAAIRKEWGKQYRLLLMPERG